MLASLASCQKRAEHNTTQQKQQKSLAKSKSKIDGFSTYSSASTYRDATLCLHTVFPTQRASAAPHHHVPARLHTPHIVVSTQRRRRRPEDSRPTAVGTSQNQATDKHRSSSWSSEPSITACGQSRSRGSSAYPQKAGHTFSHPCERANCLTPPLTLPPDPTRDTKHLLCALLSLLDIPRSRALRQRRC